MLVAIINQKSEVAFANSIFSDDTNIRWGLSDINGIGFDTIIVESKHDWLKAVGKCFESEATQECDICLCIGEKRSRWRMHLFRFNAEYLVVLGTSVPLEFPKLSSRELEVLREISQDRSTAEIAERLGISLSTVEKHRSRIRKILSIQPSCQLTLVASLVANPDRLLLL